MFFERKDCSIPQIPALHSSNSETVSEHSHSEHSASQPLLQAKQTNIVDLSSEKSAQESVVPTLLSFTLI